MTDGGAHSCAVRHGRGPAMKRSRPPQTFSAHKKLRPSDNGWAAADQRAFITSSLLGANAFASPLDKRTLDLKYCDVVVESVKSHSNDKFFIPPNDLWVPD